MYLLNPKKHVKGVAKTQKLLPLHVIQQEKDIKGKEGS
tara:strand:- start:284 stop:397 length:114 start_codon:yes stop_codon:yes gene_type:complete